MFSRANNSPGLLAASALCEKRLPSPAHNNKTEVQRGPLTSRHAADKQESWPGIQLCLTSDFSTEVGRVD